MSNMSYCRFQNTALDFADCVDNLRSLNPEDRHPNTDDERAARRRLIELSASLLEALGCDIDSYELEGAIDELDSEFEPDSEDD